MIRFDGNEEGQRVTVKSVAVVIFAVRSALLSTRRPADSSTRHGQGDPG